MEKVYYLIAAVLISSCSGNKPAAKESNIVKEQQEQNNSGNNDNTECTRLSSIDVIRVDDPRYMTPIIWEEWENLSDTSKEGVQPIYRSAHKSASFEGGPEALGMHFLENVQPEFRFDINKHTPRYDLVNQGIYFIVECDGSISNITPLDYSSRRELTEKDKEMFLKETKRVLYNYTRFIPAQINEEPCRMVMLAHIHYPIIGKESIRYDILRYDVYYPTL